ncbi:S1C family serine protease [Dictyobacter arantiisoli]|uniref:Serine protease n=1 Tax=Dictyobacter arantiisoli TaxID=2014874 RepID=A0A5A5THC2_9CHLR|nr:trypsin-like peptidase domain-containing protein [Dictyobacter arantiisoli]GCF10463.1 serine protease [Dictyobacter arantiisoli]
MVLDQTNNATNAAHLLRALSNQMADAVERVSPALVVVNGRQRQPGSGIVYSPDFILTADHVLEREDDLTIQTHDKRTLAAQFVGRDPASDLAVLRVTESGLTPASVASQPARVGQLTLAVGRASEEGPMASSGIVSSMGGPLRTGRGVTLERYIRTDATPYPGFSGGPLIDAEGAVLGVLTTGLINGIALAIPIQIAQQIAEALIKQGYIKRGYLGVSSQLVHLPEAQRAGRTQEHGLLIIKVEDQSPAQKGGLLVGDILVALDGHEVHDSDDLQPLLTGERVGKEIPIQVVRGGNLQILQVVVGQRQ